MESTFKNMVLSLGGICLVCAALLGMVYFFTEAPIADAAAKKQAQAISAVLPACDKIEEVSEGVFKGTTAGKLVGYAIKTSEGGFGGAVNIITGITAEGVIYNVAVLSQSETPGLGAKCTEPLFADQFKNLNPKGGSLRVIKKGEAEGDGTVNAISAATITSKAFTKAVNKALEQFKSLVK